MVVCRFFLSGHCQYGDNCRYEHVSPQPSIFSAATPPPPMRMRSNMGNFYRGIPPNFYVPPTQPQPQPQMDPSRFRWTSPTFPRFSGAPPPQNIVPPASIFRNEYPAASITARNTFIHRQSSDQPVTSSNTGEDLLHSVQKDMLEWCNSGMWLFSSYSLVGGIPSLLNFIDLSPEELRLRAYIASKSGTFTDYKTEVKNLTNGVRIRWNEIANVSGNEKLKMIAFLMEYYKSKVKSSAQSSSPKPQQSSGVQFSFKAQSSPTSPGEFSFKTAASQENQSPEIKRDRDDFFADKPVYADSTYSLLSELNDEYRKAFEGAEFTSADSIPPLPPCREFI